MSSAQGSNNGWPASVSLGCSSLWRIAAGGEVRRNGEVSASSVKDFVGRTFARGLRTPGGLQYCKQRLPNAPATTGLALPTIEPLGADSITQHDHGDKGRQAKHPVGHTKSGRMGQCHCPFASADSQ